MSMPVISSGPTATMMLMFCTNAFMNDNDNCPAIYASEDIDEREYLEWEIENLKQRIKELDRHAN